MSDKARYAIERSIPELEDFEKKGIFNKNEIKMIVRRRTDFEHRIAGRGSKPFDFLLYIKFEKNLNKLRKKRMERMNDVIDKIPSVSTWSITARILFIFKRGTNKFPNNLELWAKYLKFARREESVQVVYEIYSKLLLLKPRNIDIWLSGAKWEFEYNKNVKGARSLFKKCLRFNLYEERVWVEFIKFELNYLSKLLTRRKLLKLVNERAQLEDLKDQEKKEGDEEEHILLLDDNEVNGELNKLPEMNVSTLGSVEDNPVLRGDLIMTLYDVFIETMIKDKEDSEKEGIVLSLSDKVLSIVDKFDILDRTHMCDYVIKDLNKRFPNNLKCVILLLTLSLRYIDLNDQNFINELQINVKYFQSWYLKSKNDEDFKNNVKSEYIKFIDEKYIQHSEGDMKNLLNLLIKKL